MNPAAYVIGQFYMVPCVPWVWHGRFGYWPVLGPRHEDGRIIGFRHQHYHLDYRFLSSTQRRFVDSFYRSAWTSEVYRAPLCQLGSGWGGGLNDFPFGNHAPQEEPELQRRRCNYEFPYYPIGMAPWQQPLEDAYECAKMKAGVCPHQGAPLDGLPVVDGVVTCPLHGLRWNVETGDLVRITQKAKVPA